MAPSRSPTIYEVSFSYRGSPVKIVMHSRNPQGTMELYDASDTPEMFAGYLDRSTPVKLRSSALNAIVRHVTKILPWSDEALAWSQAVSYSGAARNL